MNSSKKICLLLLLLLCVDKSLLAQVVSQKRLIDNESHKSWESLGDYNISNDGNWTWYNRWYGGNVNTLVITSTDRKFKTTVPNAYNALFTEDSKTAIYSQPGDSLTLLNLSTRVKRHILKVNSFKIVSSGKDQLLAFQSGGVLTVLNLNTGKENSFKDVEEYSFNKQGSFLTIKRTNALSLVSLPGYKTRVITQNSGIGNVSFDNTGSRLLFTRKQEDNSTPRDNPARRNSRSVIYYFETGMDSARALVDAKTKGIQTGFTMADVVPQFSSDGKNVFFKLKQIRTAPQKDGDLITDKVDIWNYKDELIRSSRSEERSQQTKMTYTAVMSINGGSVIQIEDLDWEIEKSPGNKFALLKTRTNKDEAYFNSREYPLWKLVSLADGGSKFFIPSSHKPYIVELSPQERFVIWKDTVGYTDDQTEQQRHIYSYEISTGSIRSLTTMKLGPSLGWIDNDEGFVATDIYDLWQIDARGRQLPINLTEGYGKKNNIAFLAAYEQKLYQGSSLQLTALDEDNMCNGFAKVTIGKENSLVLRTLDSCLYSSGQQPIKKAVSADVFLVTKQTASESPNLFVTKDFKSFYKLSDIHPEKEYNWMTSELVNWKMYDGRVGKGILYKPENFDPAKKYPVIFHYYQKRSNELHQFRNPELSVGTLPIAWYVSNGYLVFIPDIINDKPGQITKAVLNSVESAAKYLTGFSWVDAKRLGLQGISFGGYETNILVAHSRLFAAAQPSAGPSDMVSMYGGFAFGRNAANFVERGQFNFGATLWERPDIYIKNSPIFSLDKVTTPVLIQHNVNDGPVVFAQGVEMFSALRRLQKPVWLLQYDGEGHTINDPEAQLDFTIRQQQFFDHYLKGKPAPKWMTEGVAAKDKGIKSGLALDIPGS